MFPILVIAIGIAVLVFGKRLAHDLAKASEIVLSNPSLVGN